VTTADRRRAPRVRDYHSTIYTNYDEQGDIDEQGIARTLNVSERGVLLETASLLAPGTRLTLQLQLGEQILSLESQVMHTDRLPNGRFQVGLAIQSVPAALLSQLEQQLRLQDLVAQATDQLAAQGGSIWLRRPAGDELELALCYNLDVDSAVLQECEELARTVLQSGQPLTAPAPLGAASQAQLGRGTYIAVPLLQNDYPLGALILVGEAPRTFSAHDIPRLERLVPLAVAALEHTRR
jgi:hypothetical protein